MVGTIASPLDLHQRLTAIAEKAVKQVKDNQRPNDAVLPDIPPRSGASDPPNYR